MKIAVNTTIDTELEGHFGGSMDYYQKIELAKEIGNHIYNNVDISFKKEILPDQNDDNFFTAHVYVLSEHDYESIRQDFDSIIQHNPRLETSLKAILQKINHVKKTSQMNTPV